MAGAGRKRVMAGSEEAVALRSDPPRAARGGRVLVCAASTIHQWHRRLLRATVATGATGATGALCLVSTEADLDATGATVAAARRTGAWLVLCTAGMHAALERALGRRRPEDTTFLDADAEPVAKALRRHRSLAAPAPPPSRYEASAVASVSIVFYLEHSYDHDLEFAARVDAGDLDGAGAMLATAGAAVELEKLDRAATECVAPQLARGCPVCMEAAEERREWALTPCCRQPLCLACVCVLAARAAAARPPPGCCQCCRCRKKAVACPFCRRGFDATAVTRLRLGPGAPRAPECRTIAISDVLVGILRTDPAARVLLVMDDTSVDTVFNAVGYALPAPRHRVLAGNAACMDRQLTAMERGECSVLVVHARTFLWQSFEARGMTHLVLVDRFDGARRREVEHWMARGGADRRAVHLTHVSDVRASMRRV